MCTCHEQRVLHNPNNKNALFLGQAPAGIPSTLLLCGGKWGKGRHRRKILAKKSVLDNLLDLLDKKA